MKAKVHLLEMCVAGEDIRDAEFLHDDERREINERNVRLVVKPLAHDPGTMKLLRRYVNQCSVSAEVAHRGS